MARKTDGEKIDELQQLGATLVARLDAVTTEVEAVYEAQSEMVNAVHELRREFEKEVALLKRDIEDFRTWKSERKKKEDEHARRLWAFGPNLVAAIISGTIAFLVAYFVPRR